MVTGAIRSIKLDNYDKGSGKGDWTFAYYLLSDPSVLYYFSDYNDTWNRAVTNFLASPTASDMDFGDLSY